MCVRVCVHVCEGKLEEELKIPPFRQRREWVENERLIIELTRKKSASLMRIKRTPTTKTEKKDT